MGRKDRYLGIEGVLHKKCIDCGEFLPSNLENFYASATAKDGITSYCKVCHRKRIHKSMKKKREQIKLEKIRSTVNVINNPTYGICYYLKGHHI